MLSNILAVGAASCIALSAMFVSELKGRVGLFRLTRWQMCAAFVMSAVIATAFGGWTSLGIQQLGLLALSSLFGIILATTTYFAAIYSAGPRITALLFSLTSPFALALGYVVLGEAITVQQGIGVALVLGGVVLAIGRPGAAAMRVSWAGIGLGVITALGQAFGNLFARPAMAMGVEPFTAMAVRSGLAAVFFLLLAVFPFARTDQKPVTTKNVTLAATSAFFGTVLGMSLLMAALVHGQVGVVSTLSSIAPVVILPMVWLRTGTAPAPTAWAGAVVAILGTALISLG